MPRPSRGRWPGSVICCGSWCAVIVFVRRCGSPRSSGLIAVSAASVVGLYDTPAELQEYATLAQADAALKAFAGPGYGLDDPTLGAVVMNETLVYTFIVVALMCMFLLTRHTRAEEETDRAELVRAAVVGRQATLVAAVVWVAIVNVVVAVGLALSLLAFGLSLTGTLAYSAAACAVGMVFIGVAAISAQVASSARAANAATGVVLGSVLPAASGRRSRNGLGDVVVSARLGSVDPSVRRRALVGPGLR